MATKRDEMANPAGCWNKADLDEPVFILRAQDYFAPGVVRAWARRAAIRGVNEAKVNEALSLAILMDEWQHSHAQQVKVPD